MIQHSTETIWVGLDVHSASITAAILHGDSPEPDVVRLPGDLNATRKLFRKLADRGVPRACYEASGAGYVLQRTLDLASWVSCAPPTIVSPAARATGPTPIVPGWPSSAVR